MGNVGLGDTSALCSFSVRSFAATVLVLNLAATFLGCKRESAPASAPQRSHQVTVGPGEPETIASAATQTQESMTGMHVQVTGTVTVRGDAAPVTDRAVTSGMIVFVPADRIHSLQSSVLGDAIDGTETIRPFSILEEAFSAFVVTSSVLGSSGSYSTSLLPGDYYVGVANIGQWHSDPTALPVRVYGWVRCTVVAGDPQAIDIVHDGEAQRTFIR